MTRLVAGRGPRLMWILGLALLAACSQVPAELMAPSGDVAVPPTTAAGVPVGPEPEPTSLATAPEPVASAPSTTAADPASEVPATAAPPPANVATNAGATTTTAASAPDAGGGGFRVVGVPEIREQAEPPYRVALQRPILEHGSGPSPVTTAVDDAIDAHIADVVDPFISDLVDYLLEFPPPPDAPPSGVTMDFEVVHLDDRLLAIAFRWSYFTAGATAPSHDVTGLTFDLADGSVVPVSALVVEDGLDALLQLVREALVDVSFDGDAAAFEPWEDGLTVAALDTVLPTRAGLRVAFGQFEVAPGAAGTPEVVIPWTELADIVDRAGPAGYLLP